MKNFRMTICYDGSRYRGWQKLGTVENTIQGKLEQVLSRMLEAPVELTGSGRTDAGVHAYGQVANFRAETTLTCEQMLTHLRKYLPEDIGVLSLEEASHRFHSRLSAVGKTYQYRVWTTDAPCVFERKYVWLLRQKLNVTAMERAAAAMCGTHDFIAMCSNKHFKKSSVRTVEDIRILQRENEVVFTVSGDGFLYNMVRIMVGTLVEVGLGRRTPEEVAGILESRRRESAGPMAPACGLTLMEVRYS